MHIAVLIKRVPDTTAPIKVAGDGRSMDEAGVSFVMNPYDEYAVEAGLKLKDSEGAKSVVAVCMGGADATKMPIQTALAMGADSAVHVKDDKQLRDPSSVARTLASALEKLDPKPDLVLAGRQSVDSQGLAIGPMVATYLGYPCVTDIVAMSKERPIEVHGNKVRVAREIEGGHEVVEVELPAVLTTNKGLNEPRFATLKGIMAAKKKKVDVSAVPIAEERTTITKMEEPPKRSGGKIVGHGVDAVPALVKLLRDEAKAL